ncbi:MAG: class I SAM-dependent methyltransferase [Proteobacteria bacterium]|nr:class I SAM-dependent methyltransferase [Pseudomonadota bacterium]
MSEAPTATRTVSAGGYFLGETGAGQKTRAVVKLIDRHRGGVVPKRILVVGCGNGDDAAELSVFFGCRSDAIDIDDYFDKRNAQLVDFRCMDAQDMRYGSESFDLVYSFHALEHIPDPQRAIAEIRRVLRPGGIYLIGTPNRLRAAGYVGVPGYSLGKKIRSNVRDWGIRLRGRFRNEFGAHAGFSARELTDLCSAIGSTRNLSDDYYREIYRSKARLIEAIIAFRLTAFAWPSVYIFGVKRS